MPRKREHDYSEDVLTDEDQREVERAVHTEPMHATLGDKVGEVDSLRERLVEDENAESVQRARARLTRSLRTLDETVRHASSEVVAALRGSAGCTAAWLRAETRGVLTLSLPSAKPSKA